MNKSDLINKMSDDAGITKSQATAALNSFIDAIGTALSSDDKVALVGFGTFSVSERDARAGRNPKTGETLQIAAKKSAKFKPGKELNGRLG
jgi:DNA-binding protein HU-beta